MRVIIALVLFCKLCEVLAAPKRIPCPPISLKHGRVRYRTKNRFVKFLCNPGYILAGDKYSTCENGAWESLPPKCVRNSCVKVSEPPNLSIYPSHRGGVLNFFCKPGFELRGANVTYCDGNSWDNKLPTCLESSKPPAFSCDFESEDLCGWNHDLAHDFDWKRKNLKTPSGHLGTGPSYDHTKGVDRDGFYMYIESSSRNENDTARLISPIFDKIDGDVCLEFFYHMYGSTTGQLRVYLKKVSQSWDLNPSKAVFWKSGNHGDLWLRTWHNLGSINEDFQIVIEGVRGKSYHSDIAIDDVRIIPNCTNDFTTESDITYSFDDDLVPTCLNRCETPSNVAMYSCDCEDACIDNGTCCVDYIPICVLGWTDEYDSTMETESTSFEMFTTTILTTKPTTTKRPTPQPKPITTTKLLTSKPTTTTTKRPTPQPRPITTPKPTTTKRPTPQPRPITTTKRPTPKSTTTTTQLLSNDIVTFPIPLEPDIEVFTFNPTDQSTAPPVKLATVEATQPSTSTITIIICVALIIIGVVLLVVGSIRYSPICRNLKKMKNSNGDSQSDVRFLTSEEILNFNLAYVDD